MIFYIVYLETRNVYRVIDSNNNFLSKIMYFTIIAQWLYQIYFYKYIIVLLYFYI